MAGEPSPWRRLGVRGRVTVAASAVLALALAAAALLLLVVVRGALLSALDDAARQRADDVAALVEAGRVPDPLPVTGSAVVQVLDAQRRVLASSPGGDRLAPLLDGPGVRAVGDGRAVTIDGSRVGSPERFRVVGHRLRASGGTVVVATSLADVDRGLAVLEGVLLVGAPLLLAGMALLTWRVVGSALHPVEELRRGAAEITAAARPGAGARAPTRALPVPPSRDEVARLAVTLNDMLARLDAVSARQRAFLADAAHELRSPLGSVRAQLEVALAHPGTQDWTAVAQGSLADVDRMSALVDDLLVLARLDESGGRSPHGRPVDVARVVDLVARDGRFRVPVRVDVEPGLVVAGDAPVLRRVVGNLVDNAVRHAGTCVTVSARREERDVVLDVVDDGPGIPAADRDRAFERFTRLDEARHRDAGGAGLGLAIVRAAVAAHGGSVALLDRPDGRPGVVVRVRLPAVVPAP
jgi:signal transduction histidine kinase